MIAKSYKLADYQLETKANQVCVLATGWTGYYDILALTYPNDCKSQFPAKHSLYNWGVYIDWNKESDEELDTLLKMFTNVVCIHDKLRQTFALGYHFHSTYEGEGRTSVGEKVHRAKPYKQPVKTEHLENAEVLGVWFASFIKRHPAYLNTDYIVPIPSASNKDFDLPTFIVDKVCSDLSIENGKQFLTKNHLTKSQKDVEPSDRASNIQGAFSVVSNHPFKNKVVTIIDDIYDTGSTLNELGETLKQAGAIVQGLVATKINRKLHHHVP